MGSADGCVAPVRAWPLRQAVRAVRAGGVIAYPTEAVYGLGCDPFNPRAVLRLLQVKARALEKGLILIAATLDDFAPLLQPLPADLRRQVRITSYNVCYTKLLRP